MSSINKKSPAAKGIAQPINRQPVHAPQHKPVVAQLKAAVSAQSVKRPVAPPVYRPQATPKVLQIKTPAQRHHAVQPKIQPKPTAPPDYRPQPTPKVLQAKKAQPKTVAPANGSVRAQEVPKRGLARNVVQLYRQFGKAPGNNVSGYNIISGEKNNIEYHIRIDPDSKEFQGNAFVSNSLFSSFHIVIEDENYKQYYPHYYYDDDGNYTGRDKWKKDGGSYKQFADGIAQDLVKSKGYPPALTKNEVAAVGLAETQQINQQVLDKQANYLRRLQVLEDKVKRDFLKDQRGQSLRKKPPLTLSDYNGINYRGKYKELALATDLPVEETSSASSKSNQGFSSISSSSSSSATPSPSLSISSLSSSSTLKTTLVTSQSYASLSTSATSSPVTNINNSSLLINNNSLLSSSKSDNQSQATKEINISLAPKSKQDEKSNDENKK